MPPAHIRTVAFVKRGHIGPNKTGKTRMGRHSRKLNDFARMIATVHNGMHWGSVSQVH